MIALCQEHRLEHRTKHIGLRYFLARELQQRGQLRLAYVATRDNTADIFTKALQPGDHQHFSTVLGLVYPFKLPHHPQPSPSTMSHPPTSATSTNNPPHLPRHTPLPQATSPPTHLTRLASSCAAHVYPFKPPRHPQPSPSATSHPPPSTTSHPPASATSSPTLIFRHITPSCIRHVHQQPTPLATSHPPTPSHVIPNPHLKCLVSSCAAPLYPSQPQRHPQPAPSATSHPPASATSSPTHTFRHVTPSCICHVIPNPHFSPRHPPPPQATSPPTHRTRLALSCAAPLYPPKPPRHPQPRPGCHVNPNPPYLARHIPGMGLSPTTLALVPSPRHSSAAGYLS
ncbi:unnamed protein product [Closterium sp. NIES-53]